MQQMQNRAKFRAPYKIPGEYLSLKGQLILSKLKAILI